MKKELHGQIPVISLFVLLVAGTVACAYSYYQSQRRAIESNIGRQLAAVADLKAGQFAAWRLERIDDAQLIAGNPLIRRAGGEAELKTWLESLDLRGISILDRNGHVRIATGDKLVETEVGKMGLVEATLRSGQVTVADLHWISQSDISMEVAAPIPGEAGGKPDGVVLLRIDAYRFLYPMIRKWPIPSRTGESLLVRQGDTVILNELDRGVTRRLLPPKIDSPNRNLAAETGGISEHEIRYYTDYRGAPVLAAISPIAGTPLRIIAKMDVDEIYAPLRERSRLASLALLALLAGCGLLNLA
jgi:hypothetical protein